MNLDRFGAKWFVARNKLWIIGTFIKDGIGFEMRWEREDKRFAPHTYSACYEPERYCLCTGIRDLEGRLIYEHDIIEIRDTKDLGFVETAEIVWNEYEWAKDNGTVNSIGGLMRLYKDGRVTIKVIGNKFDKEVNE